MQALLEGAILAVIVVWIFLRDWRATMISAVALPLSILPTFAFIHWAGYTLNTITLLALTLVIGILVDDAIVEEIGRAACRERVCPYGWISGVAGSLKKKKK